MFKKKLTKRTNVLDEFKDGQSGSTSQADDSSNAEPSLLEPKPRKLVKKDENQLFSVSH